VTDTGIVVASANGRIGLEAGIDILRAGGTALDAVVAGCRIVEANPEDHSVGYAGLPNLDGDVELDASVMEGTGLRAGAVGALIGYQDAADLAKRVMEELPHVLIAGPGSARLAGELGFAASNLLTPEIEKVWRDGLAGSTDTYANRGGYLDKVRSLVATTAQDPQKVQTDATEIPHGTVNFIARDRHGHIACAVSTSGWAWKYPGRLGDSPIIGAGNYADDRWGAAACTGRGEMALRCATAHSVVTFMRFGMSLDEALTQAMRDLSHLDDPWKSEMNIVAIDRHGNPAAASSSIGKTYAFMREDMSAPEEAERVHVEVEGVSPTL
jgi:beta-aspartyl-peptidase (threonine type)